MDRRDFLRLTALGLVAPALGACGDDPPGPGPSPRPSGPVPLAEVGAGAAQGLSVESAEAELLPGAGRLALGLLDPQRSPVTDAAVTVYAGRDADSPPEITEPATWLREGEIARMGLYVSTLSFPSPGTWLIAAVAETKDGVRLRGGTTVEVATRSESPTPGQPAIAVATPTVARPLYAKPLCSRRPACSMHAISLDAAIRSGRPTVVTFSAPAYCQTSTCGPVVDIVQRQADATGARVNFVHVEAYVNPVQPPFTLAPPLNAWKFSVEPWTFWIDAKGVVADRIAGALGPEEVAARTERLLG